MHSAVIGFSQNLRRAYRAPRHGRRHCRARRTNIRLSGLEVKSKTTLRAITFGAFCLLAVPLSLRAGMDDDLIAHWSFDDCTARDASGNGNDGEIKNSVTCKKSGRTNSNSIFLKGNPSTFSSQGGHVLLPPIDFMSMRNYSVCLWVKEIKMEHIAGESYISFGNYNEGMLTIAHLSGPPQGEMLIFASGMNPDVSLGLNSTFSPNGRRAVCSLLPCI